MSGRALFLSFIAVVVISSCKKNEVEDTPTDFGYSYYPMDSGHTWVYRVDSIVFDDFVSGGTIDTITYWVQHKIIDTFIDAEGIVNYRIDRSIRADTVGKFVSNTELLGRLVNYRAEQTDSSGRFVKMSFPPTIFKYWDGNAFNAKDVEEYQIIDKQLKERVNDVWYDSTLHVLHRDEEFFIQKRYGIEKYAAGIGLIYKSDISWDLDIKDTIETKKGSETYYYLETFTP